MNGFIAIKYDYLILSLSFLREANRIDRNTIVREHWEPSRVHGAVFLMSVLVLRMECDRGSKCDT